MKIMLELRYKDRCIIIKDVVWDRNLKTHYVGIKDRKRPFNKRRLYKLTHVIYWLRTGKKVPKKKLIHHIDHNPQNNVYENFQLMTWSEHATHHHKGSKRSASIKARMKASAIVRSDTPEFRKLVSERAKKQHAENNFGADTRKYNHTRYPSRSTFSNIVGINKMLIHMIRNRKIKPYRHTALCGQYPYRKWYKTKIPWIITKSQPTCKRCIRKKAISDELNFRGGTLEKGRSNL
jgi:hypothetical protein